MSIFHIDLVELSRTIGYVGLFVVVFAESGVFFGFFLPGWSMLFTAGLLASQGVFNIYYLTVILGAAAILGDNVGYWFGKKVGGKIFVKENSLFFNKKYLKQTEDYYNKYGKFTVVLARFVPIVRTFAPILAGVGKMDYRKFLIFNIIGAVIWAMGGRSSAFSWVNLYRVLKNI
jgi:membrane-associated protein